MLLDTLSQPLIALSPMDGVTDAPYRYIVAKYGKPDLIFTEFVHVMGICRGSERLWQDFIFADLERPVIAQLFGAEPEYFYHSAKIVCELGFDGVDINMGCPARSVAERGAGASLIRNPELAQQIVKAVRQGVKDWHETGELTAEPAEVESGQLEELKRRIGVMKENRQARAQKDGVGFKRYAQGEERSLVPVSVKTRLGYNEITIAEWVKQLAEVSPDWISIHGRTFRQLYSGQANWEAMGEAVKAVPHIPILVNGDIRTGEDAQRALEVSGARGVLVGKGSYGNPWVFNELRQALQTTGTNPATLPTQAQRLEVMLEHAKLHTQLKGEGAFVQMRKNLGWYAGGFEGAAELRQALVRTNSVAEVEGIVKKVEDI